MVRKAKAVRVARIRDRSMKFLQVVWAKGAGDAGLRRWNSFELLEPSSRFAEIGLQGFQ
jgi:hypothetical protein